MYKSNFTYVIFANYLSMIGLMFPLSDPLKHIHSGIVLTPLQFIDGTRLDLFWKNNAASAILTIFLWCICLIFHNFPIIILLIWQQYSSLINIFKSLNTLFRKVKIFIARSPFHTVSLKYFPQNSFYYNYEILFPVEDNQRIQLLEYKQWRFDSWNSCLRSPWFPLSRLTVFDTDFAT